MEKTAWKTLAIIFIILFILETSYVSWSIWVYEQQIQKTNQCYYDICEGYPDAWYQDGLCTCYEYDLMGESVVAKQKLM